MKTSYALVAPILMLVGQANAADAMPEPMVAPPGTVACVSTLTILHYADARDDNDRAKAQRLLNGTCRAVDGKPYTLLDEHNGVVKILVFVKANDWETAEVFYTLDEMLQIE